MLTVNEVTPVSIFCMELALKHCSDKYSISTFVNDVVAKYDEDQKKAAEQKKKDESDNKENTYDKSADAQDNTEKEDTSKSETKSESDDEKKGSKKEYKFTLNELINKLKPSYDRDPTVFMEACAHWVDDQKRWSVSDWRELNKMFDLSEEETKTFEFLERKSQFFPATNPVELYGLIELIGAYRSEGIEDRNKILEDSGIGLRHYQMVEAAINMYNKETNQNETSEPDNKPFTVETKSYDEISINNPILSKAKGLLSEKIVGSSSASQPKNSRAKKNTKEAEKPFTVTA